MKFTPDHVVLQTNSVWRQIGLSCFRLWNLTASSFLALAFLVFLLKWTAEWSRRQFCFQVKLGSDLGITTLVAWGTEVS